jgi:hypothetical protein
MAKTILAPSLSERIYSGTHGNESVAEGVFTVNAAEADSVIHLLSLPVGIRINSLQLVSTGGLGTATVSIKSGRPTGTERGYGSRRPGRRTGAKR